MSPAARTLRVLIGAVLIGAATFLAVSWVAVEVLTRPWRDTTARTPVDAGATVETVTLRSADDRADLSAWVLPVPGSDVGVVLVHGRNASRDREFDGGFVDLAAALQTQGYQVVALDLRGHGASGPGRLGFGVLERFDVIAAVHHLVEERGVRPGAVGVVGVSLGGASALMAAELDPRIGAVWTDAAYADIAPVVRAEWPTASRLPQPFLAGTRLMHRLRFGFDLLGARPAEALARRRGMPTTVVHGTADSLVPIAHGEELAEVAPWADAWFVEGAGHAQVYRIDPAFYTLRLVDFLDAALRTASARAP